MITQEGIVKTISGRNATILILKSEACSGCASKSGCQTLSDKEILVEVINEARAKEGDWVEISVSNRSLLKVSMLVYTCPIIALIIGALIGGTYAQYLHLQYNPASIIGGVIAMGMTFGVLKLIDRKAQSKSEYIPRMTRILPNAVSTPE